MVGMKAVMNQVDPSDKNPNINTNRSNNQSPPPSQNPANNKKSNMRQTIGVSVATCVVTAILVGVIGFAIGTRYQNIYHAMRSNSELDFSELEEVYAELRRNFVGELDRDRLIQGAAAGMVSAVGDPYTLYFTRDEANDFLGDLSGSFEGIGAELGTNAEGQLEIVAPLDDSPAKKAGLQPRDIVAEIDGRTSIAMPPAQAITLIRGAAGTTVKLTIIRGSETKEFTITRAKISNPSVRWEIKDNIGYMRISQFGDDTAKLAKQAAQEFKSKKVKGVVLDLRGNGGGFVDAARAVVSLWLPSGAVIVQEKSGDKVIGTEKSTGGDILSGIKTVVLIDGGTASASEIVAGALRDHNAATLVGTQTYGKGVVQQLFPLQSGAEIKITIAKWYTPNGNNIDQTGIEPDETIDMSAEEYNSGNDTQQNRAIEILKRN